MVLLISYDLNGRERPSAYEQVRRVIESNATSSVKVLYSQWLVETDGSPDWWKDQLKTVIDQNDYLFVSRVRRDEYSGWLPKSTWDWLRSRA